MHAVHCLVTFSLLETNILTNILSNDLCVAYVCIREMCKEMQQLSNVPVVEVLAIPQDPCLQSLLRDCSWYERFLVRGCAYSQLILAGIFVVSVNIRARCHVPVVNEWAHFLLKFMWTLRHSCTFQLLVSRTDTCGQQVSLAVPTVSYLCITLVNCTHSIVLLILLLLEVKMVCLFTGFIILQQL
jgi:hypothetical protein